MCTPEESKRYRKRLLDIGIEKFVEETIERGTISAKKLCTAFGINLPAKFEGEDDTAYYQLLGLAISREFARRLRLSQYNTLDDAAKLLNKCNNVMVITGAGISTSLGIPDFRSKSTGFYSRLTDLGYDEPEQVFDIHEFDSDPKVFYSLAGDILPDTTRWSPTHQFIRILQDKGKLLRNYTQNIDNVESNAGIVPDKLVQCHGSWATATCRKCRYQIKGTDIFDSVKRKEVHYCLNCKQTLQLPRPGIKRKRSGGSNKSKKRGDDEDSDSDGQYDIPEPGVMKVRALKNHSLNIC